LSKGNIASLGESGDTETLLCTQEFILIGEVDISDANHGLAILAILGSPVESRVLLPVEVSDVTNTTCKHIIVHSLKELLLIYLDGDEGLNLGSNELVGQVITAHVSQLVHDGIDFLTLGLEGLRTLPLFFEALGHLLGEDELDTEESNLRLVLVDELD
jgi:hypothetical protein